VFGLNGCQMWHLTVREEQVFENKHTWVCIIQSSRETEKTTQGNIHGLI